MRPLIVTVFVAWAWLALLALPHAAEPGPRVVPACEEDEVIVGTGDFAGGYWTGYQCVNFEEVR